MKNEKPIELKIHNAAQYLKSRNEKQAIRDIELFSKQAKEARKSTGKAKYGQEMRHVAEIPLTLYNSLPENIKNDPKELQKWLETYGKQFMIVDKL